MLERQHRSHPLDDLQQSTRLEDLVRAQAAIKEVHVAAPVREYIVTLVEATRRHDDVYLGASPRGSLALYNATRAWAALHGRDFVTPDDVKMLAEATLAHRIIVNPAARIKNVDSRVVIADVLVTVPVPGAQPVAPAGRGWGTRRAERRRTIQDERPQNHPPHRGRPGDRPHRRLGCRRPSGHRAARHPGSRLGLDQIEPARGFRRAQDGCRSRSGRASRCARPWRYGMPAV